MASRKNTVPEYQVKYRYKYIISITVKAGSEEEAKKKASDKMEKEFSKFLVSPDVEITDDKREYIGTENLYLWSMD